MASSSGSSRAPAWRRPPGGSHLGRGTRNELVDLGDGAYLELIGPDPDQPDTADRAHALRHRLGHYRPPDDAGSPLIRWAGTHPDPAAHQRQPAALRVALELDPGPPSFTLVVQGADGQPVSIT